MIFEYIYNNVSINYLSEAFLGYLILLSNFIANSNEMVLIVLLHL